jgi:hypothetical protein
MVAGYRLASYVIKRWRARKAASGAGADETRVS